MRSSATSFPNAVLGAIGTACSEYVHSELDKAQPSPNVSKAVEATTALGNNKLSKAQSLINQQKSYNPYNSKKLPCRSTDIQRSTKIIM